MLTGGPQKINIFGPEEIVGTAITTTRTTIIRTTINFQAAVGFLGQGRQQHQVATSIARMAYLDRDGCVILDADWI
jgi:hypothetical protein